VNDDAMGSRRLLRVPLAIVDGAGKVDMPIAADRKKPNAKLMPFIEGLRSSGTVTERR
jgi:hypothetical protein